jgi:hypothetical protein
VNAGGGPKLQEIIALNIGTVSAMLRLLAFVRLNG